MSVLALLLADGRFPAGGHAHSGGIEAAVNEGRVADEASLHPFLRGRLATAGRVAAALAAAARTGRHGVEQLDAHASARMSSPALRQASRAQGRQLLRAAAEILGRPIATVEAHHAVAIGLVARAAGQSPQEAARWAGYESVSTPAGAAVRLLGLDPYGAWRAVASLAPALDELAAEAAAVAACGSLDRLPAGAAPLLDVAAERHAASEVRLFAS